MENDQWLINGSPKGRALETSDFKRHTMLLPPLTEGEVLVKVEMLSFDPSQKGQMENVGYAAETEFGQVMNATGVGEVVESNVDRFPIGAKVMGSLGWQRYAVMAAQKLEVITGDAPLAAHLGPLGGTGLTAYFGLFRVGRPMPGDTVLVSGAAGATGSIVGQLAKLAGCRVVGALYFRNGASSTARSSMPPCSPPAKRTTKPPPEEWPSMAIFWVGCA